MISTASRPSWAARDRLADIRFPVTHGRARARPAAFGAAGRAAPLSVTAPGPAGFDRLAKRSGQSPRPTTDGLVKDLAEHDRGRQGLLRADERAEQMDHGRGRLHLAGG